MSIRHYVIVKDGDKELFREQILGNNQFADDSFYKALGLEFDGECLREHEIDYSSFLSEYWKYTARTVDREKLKEEIENLLGLVDDGEMLGELIYVKNHMLLSYFALVNRLTRFSDRYNIEKLDDRYKLYIEAY